jgi:glycerol-3-phosphate dehydrogenase
MTRFARDQALARLADTSFDVLVIGGGITGAGVALDAAARGLCVALVERDDFASGTSSKSSKLVHGGLRYLQQREYRLVYENLAERQRLLHNAPHLVHPLPFLIPVFGKDGVANRAYARAVSTALWMYDLTGGLRIGHRHERVSKEQALAHLPTLDTSRLVEALLYYDAQTDDARLTLEVARTAVLDHGAVAANHAGVTELLRHPSGQLCGAVLSGPGCDGLEVRAAAVVNATGVWVDEVRALDAPDRSSWIRPAKGVHLTVPAAKLPCDIAAVLTVPRDKRSIFVVPWSAEPGLGGDGGATGFTYLGTTDTDYRGSIDRPECTPEDVEYILSAVNASVSSPLSADDVVGSWAGLRPLVRGQGVSERTSDLSRRHSVRVSDSGLVTITGGKLTTYRKMAAGTVDVVVKRLGKGSHRSPTADLVLRGAGPGPEPGAGRHLFGRYGTESRAVVAMVEADPDLGRPLVPGLPYLRAEAVYAARYEMATSVTDVLARRTRAILLARDASAQAAPEVAGLLAPELGWSAAEAAAQVADYRGLVDRERVAAGLEVTRQPAATGGRLDAVGGE